MKPFGKAQVLRIYVDENLKVGSILLYRAIIKKWLTLKMSGATVYKAVEGFGSSAFIHDAGLLEVMENLPMVIETVDRVEKIKKALKAVEPLLPKHCLVTVQDIKVVRYSA